MGRFECSWKDQKDLKRVKKSWKITVKDVERFIDAIELVNSELKYLGTLLNLSFERMTVGGL